MQRALQEHIAHLEQRIEFFKKQLAEQDRSPQEKVGLQVDLDIAERSLVYFRKAYELERKISN
jgi:hypothetical protein